MEIHVREYRRDNYQWTIQRNWQHRAHKTKKDTAKTHDPSYKQLEIKTYPTSFLCRHRNGHQNAEFRT
jgi:hypothetical protein